MGGSRKASQKDPAYRAVRKKEGKGDANIFEDLGMKSSHPEALWFLSEVGQTAILWRVWEGQELEKNKGGLIPFFGVD